MNSLRQRRYRTVACAMAGVALCFFTLASTAHASPFGVPEGTPADPFSFTNLTITLGGSPVGSTGNLIVTGTADATTNIDANGVGGSYGGKWSTGPGNGTFNYNGSSLEIETIYDVLIDIGLGTVLVDLVGVGIDLQSTDIDVTGNEWEVGFGAQEPTQFDLSLNAGAIILHDGTGFLASVDDTIDLVNDPISIGIADLVANEFAIGGTADNLSISNFIPAIAVDLDPEGELIGAGIIFAQLDGEVYLESVPEPTSFALLGLAMLGVCLRRNRKRAA